MAILAPALNALVGEESLAFVMNVSRLVDAANYAIAENHQLRRASAEEILAIRETVQRFMHMPGPNPWEQRTVKNGQIERMREEDWRYYVISFTGTNQTLSELEEAFILARAELQVGFSFLNIGGGVRGVAWHSGRLFQKLDSLRDLVFFEISAANVDEISVIHSQLARHDERLLEVRRLVRQLQDLEAVPLSSPLLFLGYFAILESLLTHRPKPTDPYESITRQVKKKITLLDNRLEHRIDYAPFGGALPETIWTKMYEYRSLLAHGGEARFDGDLQLLRTKQNALKLVRASVKSALRHALVEPQLLADLRGC